MRRTVVRDPHQHTIAIVWRERPDQHVPWFNVAMNNVKRMKILYALSYL